MDNDYYIVCIGASTPPPPPQTPPPPFLPPPPGSLLNLQSAQDPLFLGKSLPIFGSLWTPPPKIRFFIEPP